MRIAVLSTHTHGKPMKSLIAALLFAFAGVAGAETMFYMENRVGGQVQFTDTTCPYATHVTGEAYTVNIVMQGEVVVSGCWSHLKDSTTIIASWHRKRNGEVLPRGPVSTYDFREIEITPAGRRFAGSR